MSQALQSLNSILKYKNERERQKIDRSLSMMDMATRLRQQQLENTRQNQIMQMRVKQENRASKLFSNQDIKSIYGLGLSYKNINDNQNAAKFFKLSSSYST